MSEVLHFHLVPEKAAARRVRRAIASRGACAGTVVGTWGELVDQARRVYLLSLLEPEWEARLVDASGKVKDAFWSISYESDPEGTLEVLGRELKRLLSALGPGRQIEPGSWMNRTSVARPNAASGVTAWNLTIAWSQRRPLCTGRNLPRETGSTTRWKASRQRL